MSSNVQVSRSPVYSHFAESLAGMDTIRAYGYQSRFALMSDSRVDYNHRYGPLAPGQGLNPTSWTPPPDSPPLYMYSKHLRAHSSLL